MGRPITIFTGQWADLPFEEVCKMMSDIGFDGLEIACWGDHMDVKRAATDPDYVEEKKAILDKYDLECVALGQHLTGQCIGSVYDKRYDNFAPDEFRGDPEKIREWAIEDMKYSARAAKNMGCDVVTGFTGSPIWNFFYSFPQTTEEMIEEGYQEIVDLFTPIFDEFDKYGIKFALEVHPTEIAYDFYTSERLLEAFDYRETLGFNFDPSHFLWQGMKPHLFIRDFADRIYHVHLKDAAVNPDGRACIIGSHLPFGDVRRGWNFQSLGHGDVEFEKIIRELNAVGYEGPLSIEWEDNGMDRIFGVKEAFAFAQSINFQPNTGAFDDSMKN